MNQTKVMVNNNVRVSTHFSDKFTLMILTTLLIITTVPFIQTLIMIAANLSFTVDPLKKMFHFRI